MRERHLTAAVSSPSRQAEDIVFHAVHFEPEDSWRGTVLFCLPGGGASKDYYNLAEHLSFAKMMTARGYDVVAMDHPGTGDNPLPTPHPFLTPWQSADYISGALSQFMQDPMLSGKPIIGIGHSMGGMMTVLTQARHEPFKRLAMIGSSAGGLDWGLDDHEKTFKDDPDRFAANLERLTLNKFKVPFPPSMGGPSGDSITFGGETAELSKALREVSINLYAAGGMMSMTRGSFMREAEAIDVPMFFAFGDHDIGIPPSDAPKDFTGAPSAKVIVLENAGHNSFAFASIHTLCDKLDGWIQSDR